MRCSTTAIDNDNGDELLACCAIEWFFNNFRYCLFVWVRFLERKESGKLFGTPRQKWLCWVCWVCWVWEDVGRQLESLSMLLRSMMSGQCWSSSIGRMNENSHTTARWWSQFFFHSPRDNKRLFRRRSRWTLQQEEKKKREPAPQQMLRRHGDT